jgi:hypothetical protein
VLNNVIGCRQRHGLTVSKEVYLYAACKACRPVHILDIWKGFAYSRQEQGSKKEQQSLDREIAESQLFFTTSAEPISDQFKGVSQVAR